MHNFQFVDCQIVEVDFTEADAQDSYFDDCDLNRSLFEETNLQSVNFKTAKNFIIDVEKNKIKGAVFSKDNIVGLLSKYQIVIE